MPTQRDIAANSDWMPVREAMIYARISRSRLYNLITDDAVRSVSIRRRGRTWGKRFFSKLSLDSYFASQCDIQMH
jgi:hypothetical protein